MNEKTVSTRSLLTAVWQKKWIVLLSVVLCAALALAVTALFVTPKYETSAVFFLRGEDAQTLVESGIYILQTRQSLDAILDYAGLDYSREQLSGMLSAGAMGETALLEVRVVCDQPELARTVADAVAAVLPQRMAEVIPGTVMELADVPEVPAKPVSPSYGLHLLIGLIVGLAVPVVAIVIREYWKVAL